MKTFFKNLLFLFILMLIVLLMYEGVLRIVRIPAIRNEPYFFGFTGCPEYFEKVETDDLQVLYKTNPDKKIEQTQFDVVKKKNAFRIFTFGGSPVYGDPYGPEGSFSHWLGKRLNWLDPETDYQVINCGRNGFGAVRANVILKETLKYQPDLMVFYVGNNERRDYYFHRKEINIETRPFLRTTKRVLDHSYFFRQLFHLFVKKKTTSFGAEELMQIIQPDTFDIEVFSKKSGYVDRIRNVMDAEYGGHYISTGDTSELFDMAVADSMIHRMQQNAIWYKKIRQAFRFVILDIIQNCRKHRVPVLFLTQAENFYYNRDARLIFRRYHSGNRILRDLCSQYDVALIETVPVLMNAFNEEVGYNAFTDLVHLTLRGNQIVAEAIADTMLSRSLLPNLPGISPADRKASLAVQETRERDAFKLNSVCYSRLGWQKLICLPNANDPEYEKQKIVVLAEKALELQYKNLEAFLLLGSFYYTTQDTTNAEKVWQRMKEVFSK